MMLTVAMIVKNEEPVLAKCLESVREADEIVIVDTGSTDNTRGVVDEFSKAHLFPVKYYEGEYKWEDSFCKARNYAMMKCTGDWSLVIDADETLEPGGIQKVRDHIAQTKALAVNVWLQAEREGTKHFFPRLFRNVPEVYWKGDVHNYLSIGGQEQADITITYGYSPAHQLDPDRALRILTKYVMEHPDCVREKFYLAREYQYRLEWPKAAKMYAEYLKVGEWGAEIAEAQFQQAKCWWYCGDGNAARPSCLQAIRTHADFKHAIIFMAYVSGPNNKTSWLKHAEHAGNSNVLFNHDVPERPAEYYRSIYSGAANFDRYNTIYAKVGTWVGDGSILDVGCGTAQLSRYVKDYVGFDFCEEAIKHTIHPRTTVEDLYTFGFKFKYQFNFVAALEVLEHVDDRRFLAELPKTQELIFSVPSFPDASHVRFYTEDYLRYRLGDLLDIQEVVRFNWKDKAWVEGGAETNDYILLVRARVK